MIIGLDLPINHVLFWYNDINQNTTQTKKNMIIFTNTNGWCNPTRHVKSITFGVETNESRRGEVIGLNLFGEQSNST